MRARLLALGALLLVTGACSKDTAVYQVEVGACVVDVSSLQGGIQDLRTGPCTDAHDAEVVGVFEHEDAAELPTTLEADATAGCAELFEAYLGIPPAVSSLGLALIDPTAASWAAGDRHSVCLATVGEGTEDIARSVEGQGEEFIGIQADDPASQPQAIDCMTGGMPACDTLYESSPSGSTEERIGATCGGHVDAAEVDEAGRCEERVEG